MSGLISQSSVTITSSSKSTKSEMVLLVKFYDRKNTSDGCALNANLKFVY